MHEDYIIGLVRQTANDQNLLIEDLTNKIDSLEDRIKNLEEKIESNSKKTNEMWIGSVKMR